MSDVDPRPVAALERQLRRSTGDRVGWKLGFGDRGRMEADFGALGRAHLRIA